MPEELKKKKKLRLPAHKAPPPGWIPVRTIEYDDSSDGYSTVDDSEESEEEESEEEESEEEEEQDEVSEEEVEEDEVSEDDDDTETQAASASSSPAKAAPQSLKNFGTKEAILVTPDRKEPAAAEIPPAPVKPPNPHSSDLMLKAKAVAFDKLDKGAQEDFTKLRDFAQENNLSITKLPERHDIAQIEASLSLRNPANETLGLFVQEARRAHMALAKAAAAEEPKKMPPIAAEEPKQEEPKEMPQEEPQKPQPRRRIQRPAVVDDAESKEDQEDKEDQETALLGTPPDVAQAEAREAAGIKHPEKYDPDPPGYAKATKEKAPGGVAAKPKRATKREPGLVDIPADQLPSRDAKGRDALMKEWAEVKDTFEKDKEAVTVLSKMFNWNASFGTTATNVPTMNLTGHGSITGDTRTYRATRATLLGQLDKAKAALAKH